MKYLTTIPILLTLSLPASANEQSLSINNFYSVCGSEDRQLSNNPSVGRLRKKKRGFLFCTGALIGRSCMITAGHCAPVMQYVGFDIEVVENRFRYATKENLFEVDRQSRVLKSNGKGYDWAVIRLNRNKYTSRYPGDDRPPLKVSYSTPEVGTSISTIGYGGAENLYSYSQQEGMGQLEGVFERYIEHDSDTKGGSSGAPLFNTETEEIIGIHTHGNCKERFNIATRIEKNTELIEAITSCLEWEKSLPN